LTSISKFELLLTWHPLRSSLHLLLLLLLLLLLFEDGIHFLFDGFVKLCARDKVGEELDEGGGALGGSKALSEFIHLDIKDQGSSEKRGPRWRRKRRRKRRRNAYSIQDFKDDSHVSDTSVPQKTRVQRSSEARLKGIAREKSGRKSRFKKKEGEEMEREGEEGWKEERGTR